MKSTLHIEDRILSVAVFACYVFALSACGVAAYTLLTLSRAAYGNLGRGLYLTASQF
ncbi:MAG TPA: hypothetical protein VEY11_03560 [Pyrinomonadaceae bacterium]|nr:hypothetical protein [Pyrinomonadaceae bacterium]